VNTVVDLEVVVLHPVIVDSARLVGPWQSLVNSVAVNLPHVVHSVVDLVLVIVLAQESWSHSPEQQILCLKFEEWRPHGESCDLIEEEGGS
jgi:hypothetical protein